MKKVHSRVNLEALAGGAFAEKLSEALAQVAENIQNPNTDPTAKRGITVNIRFAPNKTRQMASATIAVTTKLAPTEAIDTQVIMGVNMRTGEIEIAEYDGQVVGQMNFQDYEKDEEPEAEAEQGQAQQSGKPLDLRNRGKKQEAEQPVMVPGRDYDPGTGEVYEAEDDRRTGNCHVVDFNKKAAQA